MENTITKDVHASAVSVDKVYVAEFQKEGTKTAQLRQEITTVTSYPSKQVASNLQNNPFNLSDFGFSTDDYSNTEKRVAWIDIPASISETTDVLGKISKDSCLYRIMSNSPILSENQKYAIDQGLRTLDQYADSQVVRYGDNHAQAGQLIKDDAGKPQYRAIFFWNGPKNDVDLRTGQADDFYASASIAAELHGQSTVASQSQMLGSQSPVAGPIVP